MDLIFKMAQDFTKDAWHVQVRGKWRCISTDCGKWKIIDLHTSWKKIAPSQGLKMSGKNRYTIMTDWLSVLPLASSPLNLLPHRSNQWWGLLLFSYQVQSSISHQGIHNSWEAPICLTVPMGKLRVFLKWKLSELKGIHCSPLSP